MSFILDALKKSESERQQKSTPGISDVQTAVNAGAAPRGLLVLVGLLGLAVVVLSAALLRPQFESPPLTGAATTAGDPAVPTVVAASDAADIAAANPPADPAVDSTRPEPAVSIRTRPEHATGDPAPEPVDTGVPPAAAQVDPTETYLTFNDLRATGSLSLPDLHIDLHVYSDDPSERFVFINMNQYRENATLSEGPRLRQITTEGVLLEYVGTTFLLPRE